MCADKLFQRFGEVGKFFNRLGEVGRFSTDLEKLANFQRFPSPQRLEAEDLGAECCGPED